MNAPLNAQHDPALDAIKETRKLNVLWGKLYNDLEEARYDASAIHGTRPYKLIRWRNHDIGGKEIDRLRKELLAAGYDPETVEREYVDALSRYRKKPAEMRAWDKRAGVASLAAKHDKAFRDLRAAENQLGYIAPTTLAGAAALIKYAAADIRRGEGPAWPWRAIRTATKAIRAMEARR